MGLDGIVQMYGGCEERWVNNNNKLCRRMCTRIGRIRSISGYQECGLKKKQAATRIESLRYVTSRCLRYRLSLNGKDITVLFFNTLLSKHKHVQSCGAIDSLFPKISGILTDALTSLPFELYRYTVNNARYFDPS